MKLVKDIVICEVCSLVHPKAVSQLADTDEVVKRAKRVLGVEFRELISNLRGAERGIACGIDFDKMIEVAKLAREYVGHNTESFILKAGKSTDLTAYKYRNQEKIG